MLRIVIFLTFVMGTFTGPAMAQDRAAIERGFQNWLVEVVQPKARAEGVSKATFEGAFSGVTLNWDLSGLVFPGMAPQPPQQQSQAEFRAPAKYFGGNGLKGSAAIGRKKAARFADTLAAVEAVSGVPGRIILAIWARESGFGNVPITFNAFEVLGSRAYASEGEYLTNELVAALKIVEAGHVTSDAMKSSWAGALGQPQFMPASFLAYAADGNGDGRADIWGSEADTMASIANFLAVHEWVAGRDWGYEVTLPEAVSCALEGPDQRRAFEDWAALGITRPSGRPFPDHELKNTGSLLMPAGRYGPAFIVTPNFYVLKRYNRSDLYALYVGNLGDRIQYGSGDFSSPWAARDRVYRSDIAAIQEGLIGLGHDVGGADGLPGSKTRRAIGLWQESIGKAATCFPEAWMNEALGG